MQGRRKRGIGDWNSENTKTMKAGGERVKKKRGR